MSISGIKVLIVGNPIQLPYECKIVEDSAQILRAIAKFMPDVVVTSTFIPGALNLSSFEIRKRWINVDPNASIGAICSAIENCYTYNLWNKHQYQDANPLISVYTPTYNTGDYLRETYESLRQQTYSTWEWVVIDDQSTDGTWDRLEALAQEDVRVKPFRVAKNIGKIGAVKDMATRLCKGEYLVELDHDDMLTDFALDEIKKAFEANPDSGMVYSNCSNFFENGTFHRFGDDFWKNRYHEEEYRGKKWTICEQPDVYDRFGDHFTQSFAYFLTVGPNHVRAFRSKTLFELGGYNPQLPVADDWDLYARMFLRSKCVLVKKFLYAYRFKDGWGNTTFKRNKAIQDHLELGRNFYAHEFNRKNEERLGRTVKEPAGEIKLTIVVPSIPSRKESREKVLDELFRQAEGKPVEVVCLLDNRKSNLSEKRNLAIKSAKGDFVAFVDDDDRVEPEYVSSILEAIERTPDADVVNFDVMVHGYAATPKVCKYGVGLAHSEDAKAYYRKPNHVMAYRTAISRRHEYRKDLSAVSEDTEWAERASKDIKKEARVEKVLYHYLYNPKETTQVNPAAGVYTTADVSFVVLEAAQTELTARCLESIRKHAPGAEIVYVANGVVTTDERIWDKEVVFDVNLGFAAGCNAGAAVASRPLVCFMNNDAAFVDETPSKLAGSVNEKANIVAPYSNRAKWPQGDIEREKTPAEDAWPEMVTGLCMMMPTSLYKNLGGFDSRLLTWEDDDLCARARVWGSKIKVVGGTWANHERHATFEALKMDVQKVMVDNQAIFKKKNPSIRVIVIAKDEERSLPGFFAQFAMVTRDWCVLDTGSKDKTVEIARSMGAKVEQSAFKDFAASRNEALDKFAAGADWIIMFDPDERLDANTIQHMKETLFRTDLDIFLAPLKAVYPNGSTRMFVPKPFLFRNKPEIRWIFKVHEKLIGSLKQGIVKNGVIEHVIQLHEDGRRQNMEGFYGGLMNAEPYFTSPEYKAKMRAEWPILDYDRVDDARIRKIHVGPLVSVVMPTFKREKLLKRALESVFAQDYANVEAVVVGDCCPELDACREDLSKDPRVKVFNLKKNYGEGGAVPRNHAIAAAAGHLIAYLDDDNVWMPEHLSSLFEAMTAGKASFAFSSMEADGVDLGFEEPKQGSLDTSCVLHKKKLVEKFGGWKNRLEGGYDHDWEFFSRWVKGKEPWAATKKPTLVYNVETCGQKDYLRNRVKLMSKGR